MPVSIITGIDATDKDDIAISIDANDIRITTSDMTEVVKLYNINGRLIKQSSIKSNNFTFQNDLESGTYLLLIENDKVSIKTIQILK